MPVALLHFRERENEKPAKKQFDVASQPQQNRCDICGAVFRSAEELERHRSECEQKARAKMGS
jgi:hypothetical protein